MNVTAVRGAVNSSRRYKSARKNYNNIDIPNLTLVCIEMPKTAPYSIINKKMKI